MKELKVNSKRARISALLLAPLLATASVTPIPAGASLGGQEVRGNTFAVGMTFKDVGVDSVCSGALIGPKLIVTAAHCVVGQDGSRNKGFIFTAPGTALDAAIDPRVTPPKIKKIYKPASYTNSSRSTGEDIAFIELDKVIAKKGFIRIATQAEIDALLQDQLVEGYGFGAIFETKTPYSRWPRKYRMNWRAVYDNGALKPRLELTSDVAAACSGDSGGAITTRLESGEEVLLAVLSGASMVQDVCGQKGIDGLYRMLVTTINPYLFLVKPIFNPADPAPILKITCWKGKVKRVVKGLDPKCPKGFTLKK